MTTLQAMAEDLGLALEPLSQLPGDDHGYVAVYPHAAHHPAPSCRQRSPTTIRNIIEAGRLTPSVRVIAALAFHRDPGQEYVEQLGALCTSGRFIEQASCAVAVVTDPANNWHEIDGARAVQNMELAGWNAGVAPAGSAA